VCKGIYIGYLNDEEAAARAWDKAAIECGLLDRLNFDDYDLPEIHARAGAAPARAKSRRAKRTVAAEVIVDEFSAGLTKRPRDDEDEDADLTSPAAGAPAAGAGGAVGAAAGGAAAGAAAAGVAAPGGARCWGEVAALNSSSSTAAHGGGKPYEREGCTTSSAVGDHFLPAA
jgi:hypothetical protein